MNLKLIPIALFSILPLCLYGQKLEDKTLMTVGNKKISVGHFLGAYEREVNGEKTEINQFLEEYILYQQKLADALKMGLDTTAIYKAELKSYRDQLTQEYLTDGEVVEAQLKAAYQRLLTEVNAWHILVQCPSDATPDDTLIAWEKAFDIRKRIIQGEEFGKVARASSDDPTVKSNSGYLGYFTAFQTVMPFENAAYTLPIGELSMPVRSPDGYHIIKVTDRRKAGGSVLVKHIMKLSPPEFSAQEAKDAEMAINEIYSRLESGENFEELAKSESDHLPSAGKGGEIDWFKAGEMTSEFSEAAFAIPEIGGYSKPVRTTAGWHIIMLVDKKGVPSYAESLPLLESQLKQSFLYSLATRPIVEKLKKEYNFRIDSTSANWFIQRSDTLVTRGLAHYETNMVPDGRIFNFADKYVTNREFAAFVRNRGPIRVTDDPVLFVMAMLEECASERILGYEEGRLETKYPDFRSMLEDFGEKRLVSLVAETMLTGKNSSDTTGLMAYYEINKQNHLTAQSIQAKVYLCRQIENEKLFNKTYNKFSKKAEGDKLMLSKLNNRGDTLLVIEEGRWYRGENADMDKLDWKRGTERTTINGYPAIIKIEEVNPPAPLPFESVREEMVSGYLESVGKRWIEQLKTDYPVIIDDSVLNEVKREIE